MLDLTVQFESPWHRYYEKFELNLSRYVFIVADRSPPYDIFMVKRLKGPNAVQKVCMLQRVQHQYFYNMVDCFSFEGSHYAVFQHLPVTLANIVYLPPYPTERELAAALAQVRPDINDSRLADRYRLSKGLSISPRAGSSIGLLTAPTFSSAQKEI